MRLLPSAEGEKLSKRHGDTAVRDYAAQGYLPEALVNFFALMGWYPEDGRELFTVPELIARFRIEEMGKSGAVFDVIASVPWWAASSSPYARPSIGGGRRSNVGERPRPVQEKRGAFCPDGSN